MEIWLNTSWFKLQDVDRCFSHSNNMNIASQYLNVWHDQNLDLDLLDFMYYELKTWFLSCIPLIFVLKSCKVHISRLDENNDNDFTVIISSITYQVQINPPWLRQPNNFCCKQKGFHWILSVMSLMFIFKVSLAFTIVGVAGSQNRWPGVWAQWDGSAL